MGKYFGTDGVRGLAGRDVSSTIAYRIGRYLGQYPNGKANRILIARDTRISGQMLSSGLVAGLTSSGSAVHDLQVSTTPSISYLVEKHGFDYGIMISASHNPYYDNGIKIFNHQGEKLEEAIELEIEKYIEAILDDLPRKTGKDIGRHYDAPEMIEEYLEFIASKATADFSHLHVLIDTANGSASHLINRLAHRLGLHADVIFNRPNGTNINDLCGSTHIKNLRERMLTNGYHLGLAFDGDADRLLMIDHEGRIVDGDAMIYLAALEMKQTKRLVGNEVVLTVMSNLGVKKALERAHIGIREVQVGDKYVQAELKKQGLVLGGEQSGHVIFFNELNTGDGMLSMVKMLNIVAASGKQLPDLLADLKVFPQVLKNITISNKKEAMEHPLLRQLMTRIEKELGASGRLLVRPSGTEPLIRIMVEAESEQICQRYADEVYDFIAEAFVN